ncbi:MAG: type I-C CRISPR-associated protein Cas8c/Csd1 [Thermoguttaceae bacterium]|nr:type I-C CRISPR-associated protein Cas8c/Csd1 [Thermoguttaceae bacterium]
MIIQALADYYDRKIQCNPDSLPPRAFEDKKIDYIIVLQKDGRPKLIEDGGLCRVPQHCGRSSNKKAHLLWDNLEYALGFPKNNTSKAQKSALEKHEAFKARLKEIDDLETPSLNAIRQFVAFSLEEKLRLLDPLPGWSEAKKNPKATVTFQLAGTSDIVVEEAEVHQRLLRLPLTGVGELGRCMLTGQIVPIAATHAPQIKITGGNTSGSTLVSFNKDNKAFESFKKTQGANAPIDAEIVFKYATALNALLSSSDNNDNRFYLDNAAKTNEDRRQRKTQKRRFYFGDTAIVFWACPQASQEQETKIPFETAFASTLDASAVIDDEENKDDPDAYVKHVKAAHTAIFNGEYDKDNTDEDQFYVLGLSPNNARIAVRFWRAGTVAEIAKNIAQYLDDVKLETPGFMPDFIFLNNIIRAATLKSQKSENVQSKLAVNLIRAILDDQPFPRSLLQAAIARFRVQVRFRPKDEKKEKAKERKAEYFRAALIKAYINRQARQEEKKQTPNEIQRNANDPNYPWEKISMSLDKNKTNRGYQLGRLFATLEKLQIEAHRAETEKSSSLNETIRSRFYGAAAATPATVFPTLMHLMQHHLTKLQKTKPGHYVFYWRLIAEIVDKVGDFDACLTLENQGQFALGYWQQALDLYTKKENDTDSSDAEEDNND